MLKQLQQYYASSIETVERLIASQISNWQWDSIPEMRKLVVDHLCRDGKRLRPLLIFIFTDLYGGQKEHVYNPAAALEVYHTATLIYDDIQDNSEFRRGLPCAHITASTSTAMNLAAIVRTLMYHLLHQSPFLSTEEKLQIHQKLDRAATLVSLGQSIDIGWHEGWYSSYQEFPYEQMVQWKSAALFSCAAAIGSYLSKADPHLVNEAEQVGGKIGILFQIIDDYLDIFGNPAIMRRPLYNDFREGKVTYPVICLFNQLASNQRADEGNYVSKRLAERNLHETNWQWLVDLMLECDVRQIVQQRLRAQVAELLVSVDRLGGQVIARNRLHGFITSLLEPIDDHGITAEMHL
jgi:geranylgeranyl pyrophosphate synthase